MAGLAFSNASSGVNMSVEQRAFLPPDIYLPAPPPPLPLDPAELRMLIPVLLGAVSVLGLAGDITAAGVLINGVRRGGGAGGRTRKQVPLVHALLLSLLLADGLVLALVGPVQALVLSRPGPGWPLGETACRLVGGAWLSHACLAVKAASLAVMSGACLRIAVSNPSRTAAVSVGSVALATLLLLLWATAAMLALPDAFYVALEEEGGAGAGGGAWAGGVRGRASAYVCVRRVPVGVRRFVWAYTHSFPLLVYALPLGSAFTLLTLAYRHGRRRHSHTHAQSSLRTQLQQRSRRLTLTLLGIATATAVLWLPHWLYVAWLPSDGRRGRGLWLASELLPLSASLVSQ